jgi:aspartyl-tRNA(Asn)/glutamyl-tRNA(Gln) amidotransferase subunit B
MRKHYSWPDLPKGYQTTMSGAHAVPLGVNGKFGNISVTSMHLEEDPASWDPKTGCVDYNRSGLPLVEIVTAPEFHFAEEVIEWLSKLVHALAYLKVADTNAGIKVDVNVNIPGKTERVEIKNISSLEAVKGAIDYELERQASEGSVRETRRYDEAQRKTISMRAKEAQDDYRFIADPDLVQVVIERVLIEGLKKSLPEMPANKLNKLVNLYHIDEANATILDILANVPKDRIDDLIYFDPSYVERPMALNMLEYDRSHPEQKTFVVNELFSIFQKLYGEVAQYIFAHRGC